MHFLPIAEIRIDYWHTKHVAKELEKRGYEGRFEPRYQNPSFRIDDWDFDQDIWEHWETIAEEDSTVWGKIAKLILTETGSVLVR